jgi:hypothetical protein
MAGNSLAATQLVTMPLLPKCQGTEGCSLIIIEKRRKIPNNKKEMEGLDGNKRWKTPMEIG